MRHASALRRAYGLMRARFGHQHWWPGETPFEVCVGAILTQNTAWSNVERAIANLMAARVLEPRELFALPEARLAELIRPTGYFNVKARRLRAFLRTLLGPPAEQCAASVLRCVSPAEPIPLRGDSTAGGKRGSTPRCLDRLFAGETSEVRKRLLAINGIGPETADSMLLYAGNHPSFVIDAYTKRIFHRHGWCQADVSYDALKALCESALGQKKGAALLDYWQDYHAQLVSVGKHFCRPREPRCADCPLQPLLPRRGAA